MRGVRADAPYRTISSAFKGGQSRQRACIVATASFSSTSITRLADRLSKRQRTRTRSLASRPDRPSIDVGPVDLENIGFGSAPKKRAEASPIRRTKFREFKTRDVKQRDI